MMRTLSTFKSNILATIQNDEIKENNYLLNTIRDKIIYPPKREKELTASERKIVTASSKIKELATSRRLSRNKVNEGNHLSSPNNKLSIVDSTMLSKASHSPNKKPGAAANRENLINFNAYLFTNLLEFAILFLKINYPSKILLITFEAYQMLHSFLRFQI